MCANCGGPLPEGAWPTRKYCSAACRSQQWRALKRGRAEYEAAVAELVALGVEGRGPTREETRAQRKSATCPVCGQRWWPTLQKRSNAVYCSGRCRVAAFRDRQGVPPKWLADLRARSRPPG